MWGAVLAATLLDQVIDVSRLVCPQLSWSGLRTEWENTCKPYKEVLTVTPPGRAPAQLHGHTYAAPHILSTQAPSSPFPVFAKPSFDSNPTGFHSALPGYQLATMFTSHLASMLAPTSLFPPLLPTLQDKSRSQSQHTWIPPSTLPQTGLVCGFGQTA